MNRIVFPGRGFQNLQADLMRDSPSESAAVLVAGSSNRADAIRLLVREAIRPTANCYAVQTPDQLVLKPDFIAMVMKPARRDGWSLIFAHTHPSQNNPMFSVADTEGEDLLMPAVHARVSGRSHAALVIGQSGFDARFWVPGLVREGAERIDEVGRDFFMHWRNGRSGSSTSSRYERSLLAFGTEGQRALQNTTVGIVGLGGIGAIVAQELSYLGVRRFVLIDPDRVELTNLNRLVGAVMSDIGKPKVCVTARQIRQVQEEAQVVEVADSVLEKSAGSKLLDADFIFGCTDTHGSRAVLNQLAYQYYIPTIDVGVRIDAQGNRATKISGRIQLLAPELPCLVCQKLLDPELVRRDLLSDWERSTDPYIVGANQPQPAVVSINGTIASSAVTMMLSILVGVPMQARHQILIGEQGSMRPVEAQQDPQCIVCSLRGLLGRGDQVPISWRQN